MSGRNWINASGEGGGASRRPATVVRTASAKARLKRPMRSPGGSWDSAAETSPITSVHPASDHAPSVAEAAACGASGASSVSSVSTRYLCLLDGRKARRP
eukprot:2055229-Lingulodinium_polyedra.AAC.1